MMSRRFVARLLVLGAAGLLACGQDSGTTLPGTGGSGGGTGGATGGATSTGGRATGGAVSTGGAGSGGAASGGATAAGGSGAGGTKVGSGGATASSGGAAGTASGGSAAGGKPGTGGATRGTGGAGASGTGGLGSGGTASGGSTSAGGSAAGGTSAGGTGAGGNTGAGGSTGGLPRLKVNGTKLQDPSGKTIVLRGASLLDVGTLYISGGKSAKGITDRIDKLIAASVQGHVVRLPVYPRNNVNAGYPFYSELPYPVGANAPGNKATSGNTVIDMSSDDYIAKVLKPAVDYATGKKLYVIIDYHQIDDATKGQSAADAVTFWTAIAPLFADYANVIYEAFNEPIDGSATWAQLKPVAQTWVDAIRKGAPDTVIIVPSNSYSQRPGDAASDPPSDPKKNLMFTAHVYPGNWKDAFKTQVSTAVTKAPVCFTEWGYTLQGGDQNLVAPSNAWGTDFQALVDGNGGSWTAWVADNGWMPAMFTDSAITQLSDFGKLVKSWLAAKANSDWVE